MYRTWTFSFKWPKGKCYPPIYTLMFLSSHFLGWMNQLKVEVISEGIFNLFLSSTHQIKKTVLKLFNEKEKSMDSILVQFYKDGSKLNIPFKITPPLINPIVIHMHFDDFLQKKPPRPHHTIKIITDVLTNIIFPFLGIHLVFQYKICVKIFFVISSKILKPRAALVRAWWVLVIQFDKSLNG